MDKYGLSINEWKNAKREIKEILIERAKVRGMISYSDLVERLQSIRIPPNHLSLPHLLGDVSKEEDDEGRGMLTVIVVHKTGDMQPGPGFFELAKELGRDTTDIMHCWVDELKKVHAYWS